MHISLLERRVSMLESIILEGKHDQEILQNFLGDDYYDKYLGIKNKIHDTEYKDIYKIIKKDPDDVKDYIDSFQSNTSKIKSAKSGAELVYNKNGWKIYRITTPEAAMVYGRNTAWCIASTHDYAKQEDFFYYYIRPTDVEKAYYFVIGEEEKWCVLRKLDGSVKTIWSDDDTEVMVKTFVKYCPVNDYFKFKVNFNSVSNYIKVLPYLNEDTLNPDDREPINQAFEDGVRSMSGWTTSGVEWNKNSADLAFLCYLRFNGQRYQSYYKKRRLIIELINKELDSLDDSILVSKAVNSIYSISANDVAELLAAIEKKV